MWRLITVIARKELVDNFRDRRSIFNASMNVLLNPLLYIALFGFMSRAFSEQAERQLQLPVIGAENAPNLIDFLEQRNVAILPAPADAETAILEGEHDVVLLIPDDYGERFEDGRPVSVEVFQDLTDQGGSISASRTERLLGQYSQQIGALRLLARGINPAVVSPIIVQEVDVSVEEAGIAGAILNLLPVIMLTAAFMGGFFMVVDMTAGERERESLEPLLINPIPRWAVVMGKYLTALGFTTFATMLAAAVYLILLSIPAVQEFTNIRFELDGGAVVTAILIMIPVIIMAVALQMLIASYARNVKEAQTYTQILNLAGFLPALMLSVLPVKEAAWMSFVPTIGQLFMINKITSGEALEFADLATTTGVTLAIAFIALVISIRLYNREQISLIG